jgi:glycosylphosphatidylinositol transamidase (GPIT) subunit GPI8
MIRVGLLMLILLVLEAKKNVAILLSSSIGYYNYRQGANLLTIYRILKQQGFSDSDIIMTMP